MSQAFSLMDVVFIIAGLYIIYIGYQMKLKGEIKESVLLPKDTNVKKCTDKAGYIKEISPKTFLYGILVTLWGGVSILEDKYQFLQKWYLVFIVVFLALTVWFAIETRKAYAKYWPQETKKIAKSAGKNTKKKK